MGRLNKQSASANRNHSPDLEFLESFPNNPIPTTTTTKSSRKQERKRTTRNQRSLSPSPAPSFIPAAATPEDTATESMSTAPTRLPLLIISIGNPIKGAPTRHDAGHVLLNTLQTLTLPSNWTLASTTSFMNISGTQVSKKYKSWPGRATSGKLVILQDELELESGVLKVRGGWSSARGHNGIKSIQTSLGRGVEFERVCVGIGRPVGRDVGGVSEYVLSKFSSREREILGSKGEEVVGLLKGIAA